METGQWKSPPQIFSDLSCVTGLRWSPEMRSDSGNRSPKRGIATYGMSERVGRLAGPERERALIRAWNRLSPEFRTKNQVLGRRSTVGCVALEITQRCNLDCTLCYLSESSEKVKDPPLEVLFERIDEIRDLYGAGIGVQVTGGDPTLRKREELVAIVRRLSEKGLRPALFTNGIKATRDLLLELSEAGLFDVAFHVDTTQERKGFATEASLNRVRSEYIERARGLKLAVIFNTTVHAGNLHEVPALARFFLENSTAVGMASFQLQAGTGRGILGDRDDTVSLPSVRSRIEAGIGASGLSWETALIGHPKCHQAVMLATSGTSFFDVLSDRVLFERFIQEFRDLSFDRRDVAATAREVIKIAFRNPYFLAKGTAFLARAVWTLRRGLVKTRGKTGKLTYFIQNFMDARALDQERIDNCSFMVMTPSGPVSMCDHNARRDEFILTPLSLPSLPEATWDPLSGKIQLPVRRAS
ncbi:MAG: radical SAM protein [Acidobacteria bacterium]|nr:radical SAM protein [Acidobacteriota bacterium]